jgi:anaerobic ribonucleoside-triphosphate reductase
MSIDKDSTTLHRKPSLIRGIGVVIYNDLDDRAEILKLIEENATNYMSIFKYQYRTFYDKITNVADGTNFAEKLSLFLHYDSKQLMCSCGSKPTFINVLSGFYEKCRPCEMKSRTNKKVKIQHDKHLELVTRPLLTPTEIKLFLENCKFNPSYKRALKASQPATYGYIESLTELSFSENIYLYYTNTSRSEYYCLRCNNKDVRFVNSATGYKQFCSMSCNALYRSKGPVIGENV